MFSHLIPEFKVGFSDQLDPLTRSLIEPKPQKIIAPFIIIAGPNGAGKTSFYQNHLGNFPYPSINADKIALDEFGNDEPGTATKAARRATEIREELVVQRHSFIFETVLSDPVGDKVAFCQRAKNQGYLIEAHFIGLTNPALSQARVIQRVSRGGHDVPDNKIAARYPRVLENLKRLIPMADQLTIYDNSEIARSHRPIAFFKEGDLIALSTEIPKWLDYLDLPSLTGPNTQTFS